MIYNALEEEQGQMINNDTVRYKLSVAIDFGTTNCAIAYSYDYERDVIHCLKDWPDGTKAGKVPTAILFDENRNFLKFGYGAIKKYQELASDEEHKDYYFFEKFKMMLYHEKNISKETILTDISGKKMKAIDVFTAAIKFLKSQLVISINERHSDTNVDETKIRWVLTVPAIWSNAAKQFTREAAEKAGCPPRSLLIALEPEAASIYCRTSPKEKIKSYNYFSKEESKYLVLDNGGGTLDVTALELIQDDCIKEIYRATGGAWGGEKVNEIFEEFLQSLFTKENIQDIKKNHPHEWIQIMQDFQQAKRELRPDNSDSTVSIKSSKDCPWNKHFFDSRPDQVRAGVELKQSGRLSILKSVILDMIKLVTASIQDHVNTLLKRKEIWITL